MHHRSTIQFPLYHKLSSGEYLVYRCPAPCYWWDGVSRKRRRCNHTWSPPLGGGQARAVLRPRGGQKVEQRWTKGTFSPSRAFQYFHLKALEPIPLIPPAFLLCLYTHPPWSSSALRQPHGSRLRYQGTTHPSPSFWHRCRAQFLSWATITVGGLGNEAVRVT